MLIHRSIDTPLRPRETPWEEKWKGPDQGLITSWERGREKRTETPELAEAAEAGQLPILPWKGGVEGPTKAKTKIGTLWYLAMWQGLRNEDLNIYTDAEPLLTCTVTGVTVIYTADYAKYAGVTASTSEAAEIV